MSGAGADGRGSLLLVFTATVAASVASVNFLQPLMLPIAAELGLSLPAVGRMGSALQLGYAAGVVVAVPLGDIVDRRRLILSLMLLDAAALGTAAVSPGATAFTASGFLVGAAASVTFVVIPYAASLAADEDRGRYVGRIMVGSLLSVPLAWVVAGNLAEVVGWRGVYGGTALALLVLSALTAWMLERDRETAGTVGDWPALFATLPAMLRRSPALRQRALYGLLNCTGFTMFWTGLPMFLAGAPHALSAGSIGLVGLAAVPGALAAPIIGRLADRGLGSLMTLALPIASALVLVPGAFVGRSLPLLLGTVVLANAALMGAQVVNQTTVSGLDTRRRSRTTAIYVCGCLLGAACGAGAAGAVFERLGWIGLCLASATPPALVPVSHLALFGGSRSGR